MRINNELLPIKLHYFFFFGAMGGVMPFMPVIAKGLGISATAVGIIFTVLPFCVFLSKPAFGYLTDYFQNIKVIVFILVLVTSLCYMFVLLIPSLENSSAEVHLECSSENKLSIFPLEYNKNCLESALKQNITCELHYRKCQTDMDKTLIGSMYGMNFTNPKDASKNASGCVSNKEKSRLYLQFQPVDDFTCGCIMNSSLNVESSLSSCFCEKAAESSFVYSTYQFWVFTLLAVVSGTGAATVFCLSDAACYEVLGERRHWYGRQRLWATISWGVITSLSGVLNDLATGNAINKNYSPGFYIMLALVLIDILLLLKIQMTKANLSLNICKDITKIFSSWETVVFAIAVYVTGALTGLIWNYEFWFLQDLGATQTLLGLAVAFQCLVGEVPMFFFSGWFIKTLGHFYCLIVSFAAFALRFGLYFVLSNPWLVLPIDILHGFTFAIFYATMTGYASCNAPSGTEATMIGILGGLYEGLGVATGSLLGGVGFDTLGGRYAFLVAGFISLLCIPALLTSHLLIKKLSDKEETRAIRTSGNKRYDEQQPTNEKLPTRQFDEEKSASEIMGSKL